MQAVRDRPTFGGVNVQLDEMDASGASATRVRGTESAGIAGHISVDGGQWIYREVISQWHLSTSTPR